MSWPARDRRQNRVCTCNTDRILRKKRKLGPDAASLQKLPMARLEMLVRLGQVLHSAGKVRAVPHQLLFAPLQCLLLASKSVFPPLKPGLEE